jgi:hypothetical protein
MCAVPADRDEFMLKMYSLWTVAPEQAIRMVATYEREHVDRLARYERIEVEMRDRGDPLAEGARSPRFAACATLRRDMEYERGYVAWCRWLLEMLASDSNGNQ